MRTFIHTKSRSTHIAQRYVHKVHTDRMLLGREMSVTERSERVGITRANLSILKNGKAKAIRFSTLEALCKVRDCPPKALLEYQEDK